MKPRHKIPLLGLLGSFALSLVLIHFILVDVLVSLTGVSREAGYAYALTLLIVLTVVRAWRIVRDKDAATRLINRWLRK
ncbi:MAG TPA: hypothetical protein VJ698_03610 [Noviherbaspirillum sp.]|uniref:hypothetical protein n=1 Tax=Noviherbaspirillum sp. TaxID=1926288 RepID=UPI002B4A95EE|nr:hypothetical protein [Noviherbaspirillum sp.]HJV84537.1 hypothetical protein [Noviherbaspirillum sp.]